MASSKILAGWPDEQIVRPIGEGVGLCLGCFDPLHVGHLNHFEAAKKVCKYLVVAVTRDEFVHKGPGRPRFSWEERARMVAALDVVDLVVPNEDAYDTIMGIIPEYYFKDKEYQGTLEIRPDKEACDKLGAKMVFTEEPRYSSTKLLEEGPDYMNRRLLDSMLGLRTLVVGEYIRDVYAEVAPTGKTKKHGAPSYDVVNTVEHDGGALATFRHIHAFCSRAAHSMSGAPPVKKTRFMHKGKHVFRTAEIPAFSGRQRRVVADSIGDTKWDLVLIHDFGHGLLNEGATTAAARLRKPCIALNVQMNSSNMANWEGPWKYRATGVDHVCLNTRELGHIPRGFDSLRKWFGDDVVISVTNGSNPVKMHVQGGRIERPAFEVDLVDATGAGDAYFAISSLALAAGADYDVAVTLGTAAAAQACTWLGNERSVSKDGMEKILEEAKCRIRT
jgi:cytidyltransferase-like protein